MIPNVNQIAKLSTLIDEHPKNTNYGEKVKSLIGKYPYFRKIRGIF